MQKWFPDRRGVASSLCAAAFGSGAFAWAPLYTKIIDDCRVAPVRVAADAATSTENGVRFAEVDGVWREYVLATPADLAVCGQPALDAGAFLVGTGATGAVAAFAAAGANPRGTPTDAIYLHRESSGTHVRGLPLWASGSYEDRSLRNRGKRVRFDGGRRVRKNSWGGGANRRSVSTQAPRSACSRRARASS